MIKPRRAAVRPRVVSPETGEIVLLEDEFADWLNGRSRTLEIVGGPGSGKTTALEHLAAVFGLIENFLLVDDVDVVGYLSLGRTIYTTDSPLGERDCVSLRLAAWTDDDLLEYCLTQHRQQCSSILERCRAMRDRLEGVPQLWTVVIDRLAADDCACDWRAILADRVASTLPEPMLPQACEYCHSILIGHDVQATRAREALAKAGWPTVRRPLTRHTAVQHLLAAEHTVKSLERNADPLFLGGKWSPNLVKETAKALANSEPALQRLLDVFNGKAVLYHATAATLLHALGRGWQPPPKTRAQLTGAVFTGAVWPGIDLSRARLKGVDLSSADLSAAKLDGISAQEINLRRAVLRKARLCDAQLSKGRLADADLSDVLALDSDCTEAEFQRANLRGANFADSHLQRADFTGACLIEARLARASLDGATLTGADLSRADLRQAKLRNVRLGETALADARLQGAELVGADLEGMHLPDADFQNADLSRAYLTDSNMPRANFRGAKLCEAGLADVSWERADLRDADFTNCAFHLGSSRSGLVGSPIACEGSRTGFYTDDFLEQDFKSPEEIRKADLRGADLRGARVHGADFYLVDLRGARYTADQADHFRRCGAILVDRVHRA